MAAVDLNSFNNMLKYLYPPGTIFDLAMLNKRFLSRVTKKDGFTGRSMVVPVDYGNPQGRSATFGNAQANASSSSNIDWTITRGHDYGYITYDAETLAASEGNEGAFVSAVKHDGDMLIDEVSKSLAIALYGSGSGSIGKIAAAGITGAVITLTNKYDVLKYAKGQVLNLSATDGTTAVRAGTIKVASKSFSAGTITMTANVTAGIAAAAAGDFIFADGDYALKVKGLAGWIPDVAPTGGDSWFGTDRSVDPENLAGFRITDTTLPIEEAVLSAIELLVMNGGDPDVIYCSPPLYGNLVKGLSSKIMYNANGTDPMTIGAKSVRAMIDGAELEIVTDPLCPTDHLYVTQSNTWTLHHLKDLPHVVADDGKTSLRVSNADAIEMRVRYWAQLVCRAPGRNAVVVTQPPA